MEKTAETPFIELPEALVEEMLSRSQQIGEQLHASFNEIREKREHYREQLRSQDILKRDSDLGFPEIPTTCGIDGSYAVERLLAIDLVACAAVAMEGLTPPSEKRHWEKPHHKAFIYPEEHNADSGMIIRGIMIEMELELAASARHDVVFLDYSSSTPLIYLNQSMEKALNLPSSKVAEELKKHFDGFYQSYRNILECPRSDQIFACMPKYSSNRELGQKVGWPTNYDDRAIASMILIPGEYTKPIKLHRPESPWHLKLPTGKQDKSFDSLLQNIHVIYFKPNSWLPALRIEFASSIASNQARMAVLFQALKHQCGTPGILEPYPLYLADRMVKHLATALPALRQTATTRMAEMHEGDIADIFFGMHGYRTESGR